MSDKETKTRETIDRFAKRLVKTNPNMGYDNAKDIARRTAERVERGAVKNTNHGR